MSRAAPLLLAALVLAGGASAQETPTTRSAADRLSDAQLREAVRLAGASLADLESANYGRAEQALLELARLLPDNLLPQVNLAIVYFQLDRTQDALAAVERARAIDPDSVETLYTLARILQRQGLDDPTRADPALEERWRRAVDEMARAAPRDPRPPWLRASRLLDQERPGDALEPLQEAIERSRDNLVLLVDRLAAAAEAGRLEAAADAVDAIEDRLNGFDPRSQTFADRIRDAVFANDASALRPAALTLQNLLRPTDLYQVGRAELEGREGGRVLFPQLEFEPPLPKSVQGGQDLEIAWEDGSEGWPLARAGSARALAVERPAGASDTGPSEAAADSLLVAGSAATVSRLSAGPSGALELVESRWSPTPPEPAGAPPGATVELHSYDLDQDERADLLLARVDGLFLARGVEQGEPSWERLTPGALRYTLPVDLDHDGDLDVLAGRESGSIYLQNRGGGGFVDASAELGVADLTAFDAAAVDLDGDGDLDLALATAEGVRVLDNRRAGPLVAGSPFGPSPVRALAAGDVDGDGRYDLALITPSGPSVLLNGRAGWSEAPIAGDRGATTDRAGGAQAADVRLVDLDLDGDLDVVALSGGRVRWLRNRREAGLEAEPAIDTGGEAAELTPFDSDGDGDLDLAVRLADGSTRLLRNQGAERNQWLALRLRGLNDSNAKNNTQGLHARIEVRVGTELHTLIGNGGINRIGLGARRQADVLRVVWTNGLSQTWQQLGARQTLVEQQVLKGSCPFLYTWTGDRFEFHTDLMWRSTLGMIFADGTSAPHQSARDWILIPGERLAPAGSELWLQVTDELWETIYVDRQSLLAVDHPSELELVVDETFGPPPFPTEPPLHLVADSWSPVAALDQRGRDRLAEISARDRRYVDGLPLARHQGTTDGHFLELIFEGVAIRRDLDLILWGWVFPSDTTINSALAQDPTRSSAPPSLEVRTADGAWRTLLPSIGLPLGKDKAMVIPLGELLLDPSGDLPGAAEGDGELSLRISSTMQVYWDAAAVTRGSSPGADSLQITRLEPHAADLHFRGASRMVRASNSSPHRFDYSAVDPRPPFPPMAGAYTRYGDVLDLVTGEDDRTVVMSPGDELTLRYPTASLPPVPAGWTRDWVLYTDGWVKDADWHTKSSQTVEPLPRHGMGSYPEPPGSSPLDRLPGFGAYLDEYQTRILVRPPTGRADAVNAPRR